MRKFYLIILIFIGVLFFGIPLLAQVDGTGSSTAPSKWGLVIHGGAGGGPRGSLSPLNTHAMFRGYRNSEGIGMTAIYTD